MEPGSSRWQPVVQETHGQREQMLQQEKEQRAARLLWQRQDARQERAELLVQDQQRLSALEQQHQLERLQELQRFYQHLAAWTEPEWGLGDLMAHGAPSWPSSPALDPNTQSEEQQALSASRSMDRARVGTWRPHGPWGPIMAQFTSPGPKYSVRGTTGDYCPEKSNRHVLKCPPGQSTSFRHRGIKTDLPPGSMSEYHHTLAAQASSTDNLLLSLLTRASSKPPLQDTAVS
ncbi:uncharacterized protein LOC135991480 [Caloenas nicobarica]|uniref:uncharacterized protein LOC135991480 n=1 Tax=Caloenas nicobarica TaxID=187106 RepID=UPI0032B7E4B3